MGRRKRHGERTLPRPLGADHLATLAFDDVVAALATPHLERAALWTLVAAGADAVAAAHRGLHSGDPAVRRGCCQFLDMHGDANASHAVTTLLDDPDESVRWWAAHALTCARCTSDDTWIKRRHRASR